MKFLPHTKDTPGFESYDIPGFGLPFKGLYWGFNYQVFWRIPFERRWIKVFEVVLTSVTAIVNSGEIFHGLWFLVKREYGLINSIETMITGSKVLSPQLQTHLLLDSREKIDKLTLLSD